MICFGSRSDAIAVGGLVERRSRLGFRLAMENCPLVRDDDLDQSHPENLQGGRIKEVSGTLDSPIFF